MAKSIIFIDTEVSERGTISDFGAVNEEKNVFHSTSKMAFSEFVSAANFIGGHNIIDHDLKYCRDLIKNNEYSVVDTLYLSPLLFPNKPYHKLVKDDKLQTDQLNNPANDALKSMELFYDEVNAYQALSSSMKYIFASLLKNDEHFKGFFNYVGIQLFLSSVESEIKRTFSGKICANAEIDFLINKMPIELAYALAIISTDDRHSVTPPWVYYHYPRIETALRMLREIPCKQGCIYCNEKLNARKRLRDFFGFDTFRTYNEEPLQEMAADAAIHAKSILAIFPTGGGKSITFQLPALISGETSRGLTVVISPLQSLMKDQVDNLEEKGIVDAVTINGLLNPVERAEAIERVRNGMASLLYISPESLRSYTIERILLSRNVVRFVIDEAHCFSAWGQDFRVDYLYIGDFIKQYVEQKKLDHMIPVSCFTATAKQKVISDIQDYFRQKLGIELELYTTNATRSNLRYVVLHKETEEEKYSVLRSLIEQKNCPTIVYASRTKNTVQLAGKLTADGYPARPFNGKMANSEKIKNQEAFINNEIQVIVATSAFGMGVDKKDVGLVVHYDISDSLENYIQEAGRAGRDQSIQAECYVLYNDDDLDKHFMLLNQTKLSISEIQQVWKAIKDLTRTRPSMCRSALEIARQAGWDDNVKDIETRVRTAIAALETAGYIQRGKNMPHIYATSILARNMEEASKIIENSARFSEDEKLTARRILSSLISSRSISKAENEEAESRVDYLADILGLKKEDVIASISMMREEGLLADSMDMSAFIRKTDSCNRSEQILLRFGQLEEYIVAHISERTQNINYKELNDNALKDGIKGATVKNIRTILYYWTIKNYIKKDNSIDEEQTCISIDLDFQKMKARIDKRIDIAQFIVDYLYQKNSERDVSNREEAPVLFSILELQDGYKSRISLFNDGKGCTATDIQDAILYLEKIEAMHVEGGFLVLYNGLSIKRLVHDNKVRYKQEDYKQLNDFYQNRIQQIHIVGEYANMMVRDYDEALLFVNDYFQMEYRPFIMKYFKGTRFGEINRNITPEKYDKLFGCLSETQAEIIRDDNSKYIAVMAGPGSGKTRVLVHKLASLLLLEDVKSEQLLMLTFSRAAATEFKNRLIDLIGTAAHYVEIKTFHSYCFDLLGKIGNLDESNNIVKQAAEMIESGEVEIGRITKTVLVIDEAQDMDNHEFMLVKALMSRNDDMRVIAVGDDDQNIYEFRGSNSAHMKALITEHDAKRYELLDNYRSDKKIVSFSNAFAKSIPNRMKSEPIIAVSESDGTLKLTKHYKTNLETAVVNQIIRNGQDGKICVLTGTNDEALKVMALLAENGLNAKLIQSNDGFNLYNLAEIRYFIKQIEKEKFTPIVSDLVWQNAKEKLKQFYGESACIQLVLHMIDTFASSNKNKYRSDFVEYVNESKLEDFYDIDKNEILVSTIHKSKGREFDSVYMILYDKLNLYDEKTKRAIYVGITRAKNKLYIHYISDFLDRFRLSGAEYEVDNKQYPEPKKLMLQLSYRDVVLDYFKDKKSDIQVLQSGATLEYNEKMLSAWINGKNKKVCKLSKRAVELLYSLKANGYEVVQAEVRFVVGWKGENDTEEYAIILPDIHLEKR